MGGWEGESEGCVALRIPSPPRSSYRHYLISPRPVSGSPGFEGKVTPFLPPCPSHSTYPHADPGRLGRPGRAEWVARGCSWEREESARTPSLQPQRKGPHEPELDPAPWGCEVTLWAGLAARHHLGPQDLVAPLLFVPAPWPLCPA